MTSLGSIIWGTVQQMVGYRGVNDPSFVQLSLGSSHEGKPQARKGRLTSAI